MSPTAVQTVMIGKYEEGYWITGINSGRDDSTDTLDTELRRFTALRHVVLRGEGEFIHDACRAIIEEYYTRAGRDVLLLAMREEDKLQITKTRGWSNDELMYPVDGFRPYRLQE